MSVQYVNKTCPVCGGYIVLLSSGTELCEKCHYVLSSSTASTCASCVDRFCPVCDTKLEKDSGWYVCPSCSYCYRITTGDPPEYAEELLKKLLRDADTTLFIPSDNKWGVGKAVSSVEPSTLTIANCDKFKVHLKEIDIEFELEPDKLENIDTLIINGYKYVKEK